MRCMIMRECQSIISFYAPGMERGLWKCVASVGRIEERYVLKVNELQKMTCNSEYEES